MKRELHLTLSGIPVDGILEIKDISFIPNVGDILKIEPNLFVKVTGRGVDYINNMEKWHIIVENPVNSIDNGKI